MNQIFSPFSSTSSTGSMEMISSAQSSGPNTDCSLTTDDEDSDHQKSSISYKERRREAHTQAEQKRRDAIKKGYEDLQHLVPTCAQHDQTTSYKVSKATILQQSINYIHVMAQQLKKQDEELQSLRKEVTALQIMKTNYEKMVKQHQQCQPGLLANQIPDEVKFGVFQAIFDHLFASFESSVEVSNFNQLSGSAFNWLEEHCKPQTLQEMVVQILNRLKQFS